MYLANSSPRLRILIVAGGNRVCRILRSSKRRYGTMMKMSFGLLMMTAMLCVPADANAGWRRRLAQHETGHHHGHAYDHSFHHGCINCPPVFEYHETISSAPACLTCGDIHPNHGTTPTYSTSTPKAKEPLQVKSVQVVSKEDRLMLIELSNGSTQVVQSSMSPEEIQSSINTALQKVAGDIESISGDTEKIRDTLGTRDENEPTIEERVPGEPKPEPANP